MTCEHMPAVAKSGTYIVPVKSNPYCPWCRIAELEEQLAAAKNAQDCAESKLLSEGYRLFCDIDACNCGPQWGHGGHANQLLREVCDALCDAGFDTNGRTILDALRAALIERDSQRNDARELWKALNELLFECDGITWVRAPSRDTYNWTFQVMDKYRAKQGWTSGRVEGFHSQKRITPTGEKK